jgi:hypothetical protein
VPINPSMHCKFSLDLWLNYFPFKLELESSSARNFHSLSLCHIFDD